MSYYKPSFSQAVAMSRGRGFSPRGSSYRGSRGSSWGGRGGYSSSRGSGKFSSWGGGGSSGYERSRYPPPGERYSSSRGRDESYRRSSSGYRSEAPGGYSGRDSSSHRSSPDRKRMRLEASSSRRSHEGGYTGSGSGVTGDGYGVTGSSSRYSSSNSYPERRSFEERHSSSSFRPRSSEEFRKPISAPPPPSISVRGSSRGGYRGRLSSRPSRGGRLSAHDSISYRRLALLRRKRGMLRSSDYVRRVRMSRFRSSSRRILPSRKRKSSEKEDDDEEDEDNDEEDDEESDEEKEAENEDSDKKKEEAEGEKSDEEEEKEKEKPEKKKSFKKEDANKEEKRSSNGREFSKPGKLPFIKLSCVHCMMKCRTFREYSVHLYTGRHMSSMRKIALRQKMVLARMRSAQRNAQREIDKCDEHADSKTSFCPLCKLNYKEPKAKHQLSESHRSMKKFLMPYCKVCRITFKSPMLYENHVCSIEHIKNKARLDLTNGGSKHSGDEKDMSGDDFDNLDNFTTIDEIGKVDAVEDSIAKMETDEKNEKEEKEAINVGAEYVRKIEVYHCSLCHTQLPRYMDYEKALKIHCRGRLHLQRYVRYKEEKDLRHQAEKIHRKTLESKEKDKEKEKKKEETKETEKVEEKDEKKEGDADVSRNTNEEEAADDKEWDDVDKDLGDILADVVEPGNKSSDEDEDSRAEGGRYDRFKYSEKGEKEPAEDHKEGDENEESKPAKEAEPEEEEEKEDE